jgi:acetolactate synthase small subunit
VTRYRLRPHTIDRAEDHLWIAPLPEGPITRIEGAGVQILHVLEEQPELAAVTAAEVAAFLREHIEEIPDGAELQIAAFLKELDQAGIIETVPGGTSADERKAP